MAVTIANTLDSFETVAVSGPPTLLNTNTIAWYMIGDGSSTYLTKDVNNRVSEWTDQSGNGNDLTMSSTDQQPLYSATGILFAGGDPGAQMETMQSTNFDYNQPCTWYLVLRVVTWTLANRLIDGYLEDSTLLYLRESTPGIKGYAGNDLDVAGIISSLAVGTFGTIVFVLNGASGLLRAVDTTITGDFGSVSPDGITLAAKGGAGAYGYGSANVEFKELIFRTVADDATNRTTVYDYLKAKYSLS